MRPQNAPFRGRGCLPKFAESLVRSASVSPVFRSRKREDAERFFPLFVCRCMRDSAHATSKRPFQGPGVSAKIRGITRAQRECESRFLLQKEEDTERFFPLFVCRCMRNLAHATSKHPFQGPGVSAKIRGITRVQCACESRFPRQRAEVKRFEIFPRSC